MRTDLLDLIHEAVYELLPRVHDRGRLIIAFSPIIKMAIERQMREKYCFNGQVSNWDEFEGIKINEYHFANEIVVHDKMCCYYPDLKIVIPAETVSKMAVL